MSKIMQIPGAIIGLVLMLLSSSSYSEGASHVAESVSAYALIATPSTYNNRHIALLLMYSNMNIPMLFVNEDAANHSDMANAIGFCGTIEPAAKKFLDKKGERYIYIEGIFSSKQLEIGDIGSTMGCFSHVMRVGGRARGGKWSDLRPTTGLQ